MKTRLIILLVMLLSFLPACTPSTPDYGCAQVVAELDKLRQSLGNIPDNLLNEVAVENGTEFNPNDYFTVFDRLTMQDGYTLDYVYTYDWMGGYPTMYARYQEWTPFLSQADLRPGMDNYLDHIEVEDTPEGYLQYAILAIQAEQFYLFWHANYNDTVIVCSHKALEEIVNKLGKTDFGNKITLVDKTRALALADIEPVITVRQDTFTLQLVTFTKWGGFYRISMTIDRSFPHFITDVKQEQIAPYNCNVAY